MSFFARLRSLVLTSTVSNQARSTMRCRSSRDRCMPRLESLEDRTQPSTFTVTNLLDSGAGSLRAAIAEASSGDTIKFANGLHGTITLKSGELLVNDSITIDGPSARELAISGDDSSRVFEIAASQNVSISGLAIIDGEVDGANGGGILIDAGATLGLNHVIVAKNSADANSSGLYGDGGGIENAGSLTVTSSFFEKNVASGGDYLSNPTAGSAGGAIDSQGPSLTVTSSLFAENEAVGPSTGTGEGNGGAINNSSTATITGTTFADNKALGRTTNGGAISCGETESTTPMTLNSCTFTGNEAVGANGTNDFTETFGGQGLGGAIASAAPLTVNGSTFTDNLAKGGDQGNNLNGIDGGPFVGQVLGGGIVNFASTLAVTKSTFIDNRAIAGNSAAGIGGSAAGGGIETEIYGVTTLTDVNFVGNQAIGGSGGSGYTGGTGFGGGFYNGVDSNATASDSHFSGNLAAGGSGGSGAAGGVGAGGAIANGGGVGALESTFLGLSSDTSSLTLTGGSLNLNVAQGGTAGSGSSGGSGSGGGVYILGTTSASIDKTSIYANSALGGSRGKGVSAGQGVGGGLYIDTGASVTLSSPIEVFFNFASTSNGDIFGVYTS
jgi:hypothetical protein